MINITAEGLMVSEKKIFKDIFFINLMKTDKPWGGAIFGPGVIILTNLMEVHLMMVHAKYQGYRLNDYRADDFQRFFLYKPMSPRV